MMTTQENKFLDSRNKERNKDVVLSNSILVFILFGCIFVYFTGMLPVKVPDSITYTFRFIIPAVLSVWSMTKLEQKNLGLLLVFELFFGISYLFAYITGNIDNSKISLYLIMTLFFCVPFGVFLLQIRDLQVLYAGLVRISFIIFCIVSLYILVRIRNTTTIWGEASYSMPAGYQLLLSLCVFTNEIFKKESGIKRTIYIVCSVISFAMIFLYGSRGSLACYLLFLIYKLLVEFRKNKYIRLLAIFLGLLFIIGEVFSESIVNFAISSLQKLGIASRTVSAIISNQLLEDSGRGKILSGAIDLIRKNPIIGSGASSDLVLLGGYPHNLFAELCIDFGAILGLILSIMIVFRVFKSLLINGDANRNLAGTFFACGFCMLLLSSTYLQNIYLFMFIGLMARNENSRVLRFKLFR